MFSNKYSDYKIERTIGKTGLAHIYKAKTLVGSEEKTIAIKKYNISDCDSATLEEIRSNMMILTSLKHPDISHAHTVFIEGNNVYIVEPFYQMGDCKKLFSSNNSWRLFVKDERFLAQFLKKVIHGMNQLHHNGLIHRELKAANLLLTAEGDCVITDFGFSNVLTDFRSRLKPIEQSTIVGSICWMAPEIFENRKQSNLVDVQSFGITVLELCTGVAPQENDGRTGLEIIQIIMKDVIDVDKLLSGYSADLRNLVKMCLSKKETSRLQFDTITKEQKGFLDLAQSKEEMMPKFAKILEDFHDFTRTKSFDQQVEEKPEVSKFGDLKFDFGEGSVAFEKKGHNNYTEKKKEDDANDEEFFTM